LIIYNATNASNGIGIDDTNGTAMYGMQWDVSTNALATTSVCLFPTTFICLLATTLVCVHNHLCVPSQPPLCAFATTFVFVECNHLCIRRMQPPLYSSNATTFVFVECNHPLMRSQPPLMRSQPPLYSSNAVHNH
jgi:hypothetical protein